MALYSFTPGAGPNYGSTSRYYFPPTRDQDVHTLNIPEDQIVRLAQLSGAWLTTGTGAPWFNHATIEANFYIGGNWLKQGAVGATKGTCATYAVSADGIENALTDFSQWVIQGGLGTLVDQSNSGAIIRTTTAVIMGTPKVTRPAGSAYALIESTFYIPSGTFTTSGVVYPVI